MRPSANIDVARVYDQPAGEGRLRILVDRLWPRGISKHHLHYDYWIPEIAPSNELRKWFGHDPAKWDEFRSRYRDELGGNPDVVDRCLDLCRDRPVTLLFAAKDVKYNQAVVLREYLIERVSNAQSA